MKIRNLLAGVAVGGMLAATLLGGPALATVQNQEQTVWKAVAASGKVEYAPPGTTAEWRRISRGDVLEPLTTVRTGRRGRTTLVRNANLMIVDPGTQLELPVKYTAGSESSVVQTSGSVLYEVDGRTTPHFEVVTPYLVAGVKGTVFVVTVNERFTSVSVDRGSVEVTDRSTGERVEVHEGEAVMQDAGRDEMAVVDVEDRRKRTSRNADLLERRTAMQAKDTHDDRGQDNSGQETDGFVADREAERDDMGSENVRDSSAGDAGVGSPNDDIGRDLAEELQAKDREDGGDDSVGDHHYDPDPDVEGDGSTIDGDTGTITDDPDGGNTIEIGGTP